MAIHLPDPRSPDPRRTVGLGPIPREVRRLIRDVQSYFLGKAVRFRARLDLSGVTPFQRSVYKAARGIPWGETRTYGEIARAIGRPRSARAVGQALGRNPVPLVVPCHRVVASRGPGGFSAAGGIPLKKKMLAMESKGGIP
jgi:methylated-DNA-[protein]-cysteine S-methyltransferase